MTKTEQEIINEINAHMCKSNLIYPNCYIGIAKDPRVRLFNDHNVSEKNAWWIFREAFSDTQARNIEQYFLKKGCDGGCGGGDNQSKFIYAYQITNTTKER